MADVLLDYAFTVNPIAPLPAVDAAYIKAVLAIVKPKEGVAKEIVSCMSKSQVLDYTNNLGPGNLFNGGMSAIYLLPISNLADAEELINEKMNDFFTILISSDFSAEELNSFNRGVFKGVIGYAFDSQTDQAKEFAVSNTNCAFMEPAENNANNMFYAFGKLLSGTSWRNQQYIEMPVDDHITMLGHAKELYNNGFSFVLTSEQYGKRLAFFVAQKQAITAAYIYENLKLDAQAEAVSYITLNNPDYTITQASLLENAVQDKINKKYVKTALVESASVSITLVNDNFRATGQMAVPMPKALWGVDVDLIQGE